MQYKAALDLLRQQIPIGIRQGLNLLDKTNGDIELARGLFETELTEIIIDKMFVSKDVAKKHLVAANYDVAKALVSIDEERFKMKDSMMQYISIWTLLPPKIEARLLLHEVVGDLVPEEGREVIR